MPKQGLFLKNLKRKEVIEMVKIVQHRRPQFLLLDMNSINILTQHRRTLLADDTRALADNICQYGLLDPLVVVSFSLVSAQEYVKLINTFYKTAHWLSELRGANNEHYQIVLSGERRLRAHWLIWKSGCSICREKYGQEEPGTCYRRHFGKRKKDKKIESRLYHDLSAIEAMDIQLSGNSYVLPKEQEMIQSYSLQFFIKRKMDLKLTIAQFARSVGKAPETMRGYLKVCALPDAIYNYYQQGFIPYGIAEELAFLKDRGENNLDFWAMRAIVGKIKVETFHQIIRGHLEKRNQSILEIFDEKSEEEAKKSFVRKTVAKEVIGDLHAGNVYWKKVLRLFEEGKLGKNDSPFSEGSPVNLYRKQVDLTKNHILPHLAKFLPKKSLKEIEKTLA
ncbi:hypothetical protein KKH14_02210, partial [Patescibacteria group bacterium]|nr:hypothetical protein [Patescibacteria group bacterium]